MTIDDLIKNVYFELLNDNHINVIIGLNFLEYDLRRIKDKTSILQFSDWANLSDIKNYDEDWICEFTFDLIKKCAQIDLPNCFRALFEFGDYRTDRYAFLTLIDIAISNSSLQCIDVLVGSLPHPDFEIDPGVGTMYTLSLTMGNKIVAGHLHSQYNSNPDGLKAIDSFGTREDYTDVISTIDYGSSLVYIMISPFLTNLEKLEMLSFALNMGANPLGHSSTGAECFDSIMQIAASINIIFLQFFISIGFDFNTTGKDLLLSAVSSKADYSEKEKILDYIIDNYSVDVNTTQALTYFTPIEWAVYKNGKDATKTIKYLAQHGAEYDVDYLMHLAQGAKHYELRDSIYSELHGSQNIYDTLVLQEEELKRIEYESKIDGKPNVLVLFPQKAY